MRYLSYLMLTLIPLPLWAKVDMTEETTSVLDFFTWPMGLITLILCGIAVWVLYKKERAEEKVWIQFFGRLFPYVLLVFLVFFVVTILLAILP